MVREHLCTRSRPDRTEKRNRIFTMASGYFKTPISIFGETSRSKSWYGYGRRINTINHIFDNYRTFYISTRQIFFSYAHE